MTAETAPQAQSPLTERPGHKPVFRLALFLSAALWGAFGAPTHGWPYWVAAGIAGTAVVELLRPHLSRS